MSKEETSDPRLEERRRFLQSLSKEDRDFIARYGEDLWKLKKRTTIS